MRKLRANATAAWLFALCVAMPALAGPFAWWSGKDDSGKPPRVGSADATASILLAPGKEVRVRLDADSPEAMLDGERIRYQRFRLPTTLAHALVKVHVTTQRHKTSPRFTVLAPQLVILDGNGEIIRTAPLQPLDLDIEPFRRTQLHGCMDVAGLSGFLLASDPGRVGKRYEFDARPKPGAHPDRGFYTPRTSMRVFMRYADAGEVLLEVVDASDSAATCQSGAGA